MSDLIAKVKEDKDNNQKSKDNESLILYFDILGYKQKFEEDGFDQAEFLKNIEGCVESAKEVAENTKNYSEDVIVKMKAFSDNFIFEFSGGNIDQQMVSLWVVLSHLQSVFFVKHSLLIRGGVVKGNIVVNDNFVFGKGLIDAYNLENSATYPRIVIEDKISNLLYNHEVVSYKDFDGKSVLKHYAFSKNSYINLVAIGEAKEVIIELLQKYGKYRDALNKDQINETEKTIRKYLWVVESFNNFCRYFNNLDFYKTKRYGVKPISYDLVLNKKLMRAEIANIK